MYRGARCPFFLHVLKSSVDTVVWHLCTKLQRVDAGAMATYCFAHYHVTGDGTQKFGARHPKELCRECFKGYCSREIATGKLHVRCPSCPRALQTREIGSVVDMDDYDILIKRIRAAEKAHG